MYAFRYVPEIVIKKFMLRQQEALLQDLSGFIGPNCAASSHKSSGTPIMTILCCEMDGFRALSENLRPYHLLTLLNHYFTFVSDIIHNHQGVVDTFNNVDGTLMCYFNEPTTTPLNDHELKACATAFEILEGCMEMNNFKKFSFHDHDIHNEKMNGRSSNVDRTILEQVDDEVSDKQTPLLEDLHEIDKDTPIRVKIGINTGTVLCGNLVHTPNRMSYTVFGTNVEIASKLATLNHYFNTSVLIGPQTYEKVQEVFLCYFIDILPREKIYESHSEDILLKDVMDQHAKSSLTMTETITNKNYMTTIRNTNTTTTTTSTPQILSENSPVTVASRNELNDIDTKTHPLYSLTSRWSQRGLLGANSTHCANQSQPRHGGGVGNADLEFEQYCSSLLPIYELVCHKNKASELQQRIQSDLKQVESFLKSIIKNSTNLHSNHHIPIENNDTTMSNTGCSNSTTGYSNRNTTTPSPSVNMNCHYLKGKCSLLLSLTDMKSVKILFDKCQRFEKDERLQQK